MTTKPFLLRLPPDLREELEQAKWLERTDMTEIILQGLAIRLRAVPRDKLQAVLSRIGYDGQSKPGRPPVVREAPAPARVPEEKVQVRSEPEAPAAKQEPEEDPWSLDLDPALSTK